MLANLGACKALMASAVCGWREGGHGGWGSQGSRSGQRGQGDRHSSCSAPVCNGNGDAERSLLTTLLGAEMREVEQRVKQAEAVQHVGAVLALRTHWPAAAAWSEASPAFWPNLPRATPHQVASRRGVGNHQLRCPVVPPGRVSIGVGGSGQAVVDSVAVGARGRGQECVKPRHHVHQVPLAKLCA